jgi:catechol 2,3-dioxygenase-like lactoylglutathione lyase family enzyme
MILSKLFAQVGAVGMAGWMLVQAGGAQTRPAITGIAFVRVYVANPARSQHFYGKVLGYDRRYQDGLIWYPVNDSQWIEVAKVPAPAPPAKVAAIGFTTRDLPALKRYFEAKSVVVISPKIGQLMVHDPEGRQVIFVRQSDPSKDPSRPYIKTLGDRTTRPATRPNKISPRAGSHRIIHTGFTVKNRDAEDKFYKDLLGFKPYWFGGRTEGQLDYVSLQVPEGTDWVEYMLGTSADATAKQLGGSNHISLGVARIETAVAALKANGCVGPDCSNTHIGRNGTMQLNVFDPDLTRTEYMEFDPRQTPCCSPFTGPHPTEQESR